jgi:hypothetical protein
MQANCIPLCLLTECQTPDADRVSIVPQSGCSNQARRSLGGFCGSSTRSMLSTWILPS